MSKNIDVIEELSNRNYFFETAYSLEGEQLQKDEGGYYHFDEKSEEIKKYYQPEEFIIVRLNEKVLERMDKNLRGILSLRGVKSEEEINENDIEVRQLAKNWQKRTKHKGTYASIPKNIMSTFIQRVKSKHRPNQLLAMMQVALFSMMADDVFSINVRQNSFTSKIDVDEKSLENYWAGKVEETNTPDDIDSFIENSMKGFEAERIFIDNTNTLEIMLAVCSCISNDNPLFVDAISDEMAKSVKAYMAWRQKDDQFFLQNSLDEFLSEEVESQYTNS